MDPKEVLELVSSAHERYENVRAALQYRGDGTMHKEIRERIWRRRQDDARSESHLRKPPSRSDSRSRTALSGGAAGHGTRTTTTGVWRQKCLAAEEINASRGRRRLPIGGPPDSGLWWQHRVGARPHEEDPPWFDLALDHYWTFYPLRFPRPSGASPKSRREGPKR